MLCFPTLYTKTPLFMATIEDCGCFKRKFERPWLKLKKVVQRLSLECQIVMDFVLILLHNWIKKSGNFFIQSETKGSQLWLIRARFRQLHTSSFDWLTGLTVSFVIGQNNYFGFTWKKRIYFLWCLHENLHVIFTVFSKTQKHNRLIAVMCTEKATLYYCWGFWKMKIKAKSLFIVWLPSD